MKKLLLIILGLPLSLSIMARDFEYEYKGQTVIYTVLDEDMKTCSTKARKRETSPGNIVSGTLEIPSKVTDGTDEYKVVKIGHWSFCSSKSLLELTIPESISEIDYFAFSGCDSLHTLTFNATSCADLSPNTFPTSIKHLIIGENVTRIPNYICDACSDLSSVNIPDMVTHIGSHTFSSTSLTSVSIPSGVTYIGERAFYFTNISSVRIPSDVTYIGPWAFYGCENLREVIYLSDNPYEGVSCTFHTYTFINAILYVPEGKIDLYKEISPWRYFKVITDEQLLSGVEEIEVDSPKHEDAIAYNSVYDVYNLQGVMVGHSIESVVPGLYIVRQGNKVEKRVVR